MRPCLILEEGASAATGAAALRAWLDGQRALEKPPVPAERGAITIAEVAGIDDPIQWREALRLWAETTWDAWRDLHPIARNWIAEALTAQR